jgi:hypothetical protein
MLMVGTLQCRNSNRYSVELYNDFIMNQRSFLDANSYVLKARFMRESGISGGQAAYDRFATTLANRYSAELDRSEFCETVEDLARLGADAGREELLRLAESVAEAPDSGGCAASNYRFDPAAEEAGLPDYAKKHSPPPPPRIRIDEAPATVATALTVPAVPPAATAASIPAAPAAAAESKEAIIQQVMAEAVPAVASPAIPAEAPLPAPVAAAADLPSAVAAHPAIVSAAAPLPAAAQPDREQALQAAIIALQSAVSALQAASAPTAAADPTIVNVPDSPVIPPQDTGTN